MATSSTTTPPQATPAPADVEIAGATTTADGITSRPDYAYAPPAEFFAPGAPAAGLHVFNVADYGAVADPAVNNAPMIQAAIQAAHDAGGGLVYIPPGVYGIAGTDRPADGGVRLLDNVFLKGAGMGETTLRVVDGFDKDLTGIVRSPTNEITKNFGVADLSLDGNRDHNPTGKMWRKIDGEWTRGDVPVAGV